MEWVRIPDTQGEPLTPESVRRLGTELVSELQSSDKGKNESDASGKGDTRGKNSWNIGEKREILCSALNNK